MKDKRAAAEIYKNKRRENFFCLWPGSRSGKFRVNTSLRLFIASHFWLFSFGCLCFSLAALFARSIPFAVIFTCLFAFIFYFSPVRLLLLILLCSVFVQAMPYAGGGFFRLSAELMQLKTTREQKMQAFIISGAAPHLLPEESSWAIIEVKDGPIAGRRLIAYGQASILLPGRDLVTTAQVREGAVQRNPGGFDEAAWIRSLGAVGVVELKEKTTVLLPALSIDGRLRDIVHRMRGQFLRPVRDAFRGDIFPFVYAFSGGGTRFLSLSDRTYFSLSGLSHLTSVSGTHLVFLLMPLRRRSVRRAFGAGRIRILSIILMIWLCLICGGTTGIGRAVLFRLLRETFDRFGRNVPASESAALAGIILLFLSPFQILSAGFWLSFLSSLAIQTLSGRICLRLPKGLPCAVASPLSVSLAAQIAVLPLSVTVSQGISLMSPLANFLAVWPAGLASGAGMISLLLLLPLRLFARITAASGFSFQPYVLPGKFLTPCFELCARSLRALAGAAANRKFFVPRYFFQAGTWILWLYFIFWLLTDSRLKKTNAAGTLRLPQRFRRKILLFCLAVSLLLTAVFTLTERLSEGFDVWFLDVGQGDSAVIDVPGGPFILIDGGGAGNGYSTILPFLLNRGIGMIDLAILTHGHEDHAAGLLELIQAECVQELWVSRLAAKISTTDVSDGSDMFNVFDQESARDLTDNLIGTAVRQGVPVRLVSAGTIFRSGNLILEIIAPVRKYNSLNDLSLQVRASFGAFSLLFTGDAESAAEQDVVSSGIGQTDILNVSHHGAKSSTGDALLRQIEPQAAIISVGPNCYGHPSQEVLSRLAAFGVEIFRTDELGAIKLSLRDGKVRIMSWRQKSKR
jgi:competence protein ComEC